jgi:hypothetical protein
MDVLRNAPETTPAIKQELELADAQWVFFDTAMKARPNTAGKGAAEVFIASENLLQVMDKVTSLFARINRA